MIYLTVIHKSNTVRTFPNTISSSVYNSRLNEGTKQQFLFVTFELTETQRQYSGMLLVMSCFGDITEF